MAKEDDHRRFRKLQSHAFSEKALKAQESYLQRYTRSFIDRLHDQVKGTSKGLVPMSMWYNFTTFDLIGDLAFAHSFGMTENAELHPWVKITFDYIKMMEFMRLTRIFPSVEKVLHYFIPQSLKDVRTNHAKWSAEKAQARVQMNTDRQDFMSYLLKGDDKNGLTKDEINEAATILILAGSETVSFRLITNELGIFRFMTNGRDKQTATVLTGVTYFLLNRPETYERLKTEIRGSFTSDKEMDLSSLAQQNYLNACLEEGLRMYPPAPTAMPRRSPTGGGVVCGEVIPENVSPCQSKLHMVFQHQLIDGIFRQWWESHLGLRIALLATGYILMISCPSDGLATLASLVIHKRLLRLSRMVREIVSGKSKCLIHNISLKLISFSLAFAEMRLILANLIWNFDLELPQEEKDWFARNKIFILWEKPELHIKLSSRLV